MKVLDDPFTRSDTATNSTPGNTSAVGNSWIDVEGGNGHISGNKLRMESTTTTNYVFSPISRPTSETQSVSRAVFFVDPLMSGLSNVNRIRDVGGNFFFGSWQSGGNLNVAWFNNTDTPQNSVTASFTAGSGGYIHDLTASASGGTATITGKLYDATICTIDDTTDAIVLISGGAAATPLCTATTTSTNSALQSAGHVAVSPLVYGGFQVDRVVIFDNTVATLVAGTLSTTAIGLTTASVSVTAPTGGTGGYTYQLQRKTGSGGTYANVTGANSLTYSDSGMNRGTTYYYRQIQTDSASTSVTTNEISVTTSVYRGVGDGNSQGAGVGGTSWVTLLANSLGSTWEFVNLSVSGQTTEQMNSDAFSQVVPYLQSANTRNLVIPQEIMNSIYFGDTAQQSYDALSTYCSTTRNVNGSKVIAVCPQPTRGDFPGTSTIPGDVATQKATYAATVAEFMGIFRRNWFKICDRFYDPGSDSRLSDCNNTTSYASDKVHWTTYAQTIVASGISDEISILYSGANFVYSEIGLKKIAVSVPVSTVNASTQSVQLKKIQHSYNVSQINSYWISPTIRSASESIQVSQANSASQSIGLSRVSTTSNTSQSDPALISVSLSRIATASNTDQSNPFSVATSLPKIYMGAVSGSPIVAQVATSLRKIAASVIVSQANPNTASASLQKISSSVATTSANLITQSVGLQTVSFVATATQSDPVQVAASLRKIACSVTTTAIPLPSEATIAIGLRKISAYIIAQPSIGVSVSVGLQPIATRPPDSMPSVTVASVSAMYEDIKARIIATRMFATVGLHVPIDELIESTDSLPCAAIQSTEFDDKETSDAGSIFIDHKFTVTVSCESRSVEDGGSECLRLTSIVANAIDRQSLAGESWQAFTGFTRSKFDKKDHVDSRIIMSGSFRYEIVDPSGRPEAVDY